MTKKKIDSLKLYLELSSKYEGVGLNLALVKDN